MAIALSVIRRRNPRCRGDRDRNARRRGGSRDRPTAALTRTIAAVGTDRLHVTVVPARYAKAELHAQVDSIASDALTAKGDRGISIAAPADGSGIRVGVQRAPGPRAALVGSALPHLQQAMRTGAVTVFEQEPRRRFAGGGPAAALGGC